MGRGHGAIAGLLLCAAGPAAAADEQPICADRPSKATSPCTAPAGSIQVESGIADWSLSKSNGERDTSLVIGETALKYGLSDHSDIELDVSPFVRATSRSADAREAASGFGDLRLIYKQELIASEPLQLAF